MQDGRGPVGEAHLSDSQRSHEKVIDLRKMKRQAVMFVVTKDDGEMVGNEKKSGEKHFDLDIF